MELYKYIIYIYTHIHTYIYAYKFMYDKIRIKLEQAEPRVKHPKIIHILHQEETVNTGFK